MEQLYFIICSFVLTITILSPLQTYADESQENLNQLLFAYQSSVNRNNYSFIVSTIPPLVLNDISNRAKVDISVFPQVLTKELEKQATALNRKNFIIDINNVHLYKTTDGSDYMRVPVEYQIIDNNKVDLTLSVELFGLKIDGKWYFVRSDDSYFLKFWKSHYPLISAIDFKQNNVRRTNAELNE